MEEKPSTGTWGTPCKGYGNACELTQSSHARRGVIFMEYKSSTWQIPLRLVKGITCQVTGKWKPIKIDYGSISRWCEIWDVKDLGAQMFRTKIWYEKWTTRYTLGTNFYFRATASNVGMTDIWLGMKRIFQRLKRMCLVRYQLIWPKGL